MRQHTPEGLPGVNGWMGKSWRRFCWLIVTIFLGGSDLSITVEPNAGGRVTSLRFRGIEMLGGAGDTDGPVAEPAFLSGSFPMAPWAGRIGYGRVEIGEVVHQLQINGAPHAMHGTTYDVPWAVVSASDNSCELTTNLGKSWPFGGTASQRFEVADDQVFMQISVRADAEPMPGWVGFHPWFVRNIGDSEAQISIPRGSRMFVRNEAGLPTGALVDVPPGPWDDCFVVGEQQPVVITWAGVAAVALSSDSPYVVVYDELPDALCVEPQSAPPDALALRRAPRLAPGEENVLRARLAFTAL